MDASRRDGILGMRVRSHAVIVGALAAAVMVLIVASMLAFAAGPAAAKNRTQVFVENREATVWTEAKPLITLLNVTVQRNVIDSLPIPKQGKVTKAFLEAAAELICLPLDLAQPVVAELSLGLALPIAVAIVVGCPKLVQSLVLEHTLLAKATEARRDHECLKVSFPMSTFAPPIPIFYSTPRQDDECWPLGWERGGPSSVATPRLDPLPKPGPGPGPGPSTPGATPGATPPGVAPRPALTYKWRWEGQQAFTTSALSASADVANMQPGSTVWIKLTARNAGTATWRNSGADAVLLGTDRPRNRNSAFVASTRPARMRESSVGPGERATFVFPLRAPATANSGQAREYFNLVSGNTWFNDEGFFVAPRVLSYQWEWAGQAAYTDSTQSAGVDLEHLRPGQLVWLVVRAQNTGTATWVNSGAHPMVLGTSRARDRPSAFYHPSWLTANRPTGMREGSVAPGQVGTFGFYASAPLGAAASDEYFNLVASGLMWLNDPGQFYRMRVTPIVGIAPTRSGAGYWLVAADGGVFSFGDAQFYGSMGGKPLNKPIVGIAPTRSGAGYWLVAADGGVFSFGDAQSHGSMGGRPLNAPMVGMAASPDGRGYWLVAADGGVFAFPEGAGGLPFHGSMGGRPLNAPMVGMAASPDGRGYWLVAADGGVFAFPEGAGGLPFHGSMGGTPPGVPIVGMAPSVSGRGYWLAGGAETVTRFGDAGTPRETATVPPIGLPPVADLATPQLIVEPTSPPPVLRCKRVRKQRIGCTVRLSARMNGQLRLVTRSNRARRTHKIKLKMGRRLDGRMTIKAAGTRRGSRVRLTTAQGRVLAETRLR
jgi:hypothetical protein